MSTIQDKKNLIIEYIKTNLKDVDPNGTNVSRYTDMFTKMSDKEFDTFMKNMRDGKWQFNFTIPNMTKRLSMDNILAATEKVGIHLFDYVWLKDPHMGFRYRTGHKLPIFKLPIRRMQQFLDKKLSVPDSDKRIDMITGQVTGKDESSALSNPEIQSLYSKNLKNVLNEFITVRGGDITSYGHFKAQLEEGGQANLKAIPGGSVSRTAQVTEVLLASMHLDTNLTEQ